jgi:hypothetical protein
VSEEPTTIGPAAPEAPVIRVSEHPAAARSIRRLRGWAGIAGFVLLVLLSRRAGLPGTDTVLRALIGGVAFHLVAWVLALAVWRRLVIIELEQAHRRRQDAVRAAFEEAAEAAAG